MYRGKSVSVVFATYRERASIRSAIEDFFATGFVDEIIVVNNNAEAGTDEEVKKTAAKLIYEKRQGYGYTYQTGIAAAVSDYIVLVEPDGTFVGSDLERFLIYASDFPVIFGTRTSQSSVFKGAAMGLMRKWADVLEGKFIEILFMTNALTDVGCTYKLFHREAVQRIAPLWKEGGALFATELILLTASQRIPFVEIPITFQERVGKSTLTARWWQLASWGLRILWFIFRFWVRWIFSKIFKRENKNLLKSV